MPFCENVKKNLCFLTANISTTQLVASVINEDDNVIISFSTNQIQNKLESTPEDNSIEKESLETWNYNDFHDKCGHHGDEKMRAMAKRMSFRLTGKSSSCDACSLIKAKAKAIPKTTEKRF